MAGRVYPGSRSKQDNLGKNPIIIGRQTSTIIDLMLTQNTLSNNWKVTDKITLSDHALIRFNMDWTLPRAIKVHNMSKVDWFKFCSLTETETVKPQYISEAWVDSECESVTKLITPSLDASALLMTINLGLRDRHSGLRS